MEKKRVDEWVKRYQEWISKAAERKEEFVTRSDIRLKPLYTSADLEGFDEERDLGFPGEYPYTRGVYTSMYRSRAWTKRLLAGYETPEAFNKRQRDLLKAGAEGLNIIPDLANLRGYDSDGVELGQMGRCGVILDTLQDMETALDGISLEETSVNWNEGAPCAYAAFYFVLAKKQGIPLAKLTGTSDHNDFISCWLACNVHNRFPLEGSLRCCIDLVKFCTESVPKWHHLCVIGQHMGEQGATPVQEIAFTLSSAIFYVNELVKAGLDVDTFAPRMSYFFTVQGDFFETIAKFRAGRRMWAKIMRERFGAKDPRSWQFRFYAQTTGAELTQQQPLNNIIRSAFTTLSAVLGGAQGIHTDSFDEALWSPHPQAQRIALMTQNIIADETGVADVIDPLGGSYYVEHLTNEVEKKAWDYIETIDSKGGMLEAVKTRFIESEILKSIAKHQKTVESGKKVVVGVNKYIVHEAEEEYPPQAPIDVELLKRQVEKTKRFKRERDQQRVRDALSQLRGIAETGEGNITAAIMEAAGANATQGEVVQTLREVFGFGRPSQFR